MQLAQAQGLHVDWYSKPELKDVLYDGELWWFLDEQKLKTASSLNGWLQGTEQATIDTDDMSETKIADRLLRVGGEVATTYNKGKILRFPNNAVLPVLSSAESIHKVYTSETEILGGENLEWKS